MCMSSIVTYACVTCISVYLGYTVPSLAVGVCHSRRRSVECVVKILAVARASTRYARSMRGTKTLLREETLYTVADSVPAPRARPRGAPGLGSRADSTRRALYPDHARRVPPPARETPGCASLMPPRRRPVFSVSLAARASSVQRLARSHADTTRARTFEPRLKGAPGGCSPE